MYLNSRGIAAICSEPEDRFGANGSINFAASKAGTCQDKRCVKTEAAITLQLGHIEEGKIISKIFTKIYFSSFYKNFSINRCIVTILLSSSDKSEIDKKNQKFE